MQPSSSRRVKSTSCPCSLAFPFIFKIVGQICVSAKNLAVEFAAAWNREAQCLLSLVSPPRHWRHQLVHKQCRIHSRTMPCPEVCVVLPTLVTKHNGEATMTSSPTNIVKRQFVLIAIITADTLHVNPNLETSNASLRVIRP